MVGDEALNKVFRDIYSNGSDGKPRDLLKEKKVLICDKYLEQRRAMIKSFYESGGTVLSTNWDEVGKGEVKGSPPKVI